MMIKELSKTELEQALKTSMSIAENSLMILMYTLNDRKIELNSYGDMAKNSASYKEMSRRTKAETDFVATNFAELGELKNNNNIYFSYNGADVEMSLGNKKLLVETYDNFFPREEVQSRIREFFSHAKEE